MSYPTLEQYNEALQHHQSALTDPTLRSGKVSVNGLGLPLALCGGFALTYTINSSSKKYAVRCFHKQSNALEVRYNAVAAKLQELRSEYFLDFEFQPKGVRVNGTFYPVVKMLWASGTTLGEFVEASHTRSEYLRNLSGALRQLAKYLEAKKLAHGDLQPGNLMVANCGRSIQLIDYDGMYVDKLAELGSSELGHRNFQHPKRTSSNWNYKLDRFSFIALYVSISTLERFPQLWKTTSSDGDGFLFRANDYADPARSPVFTQLLQMNELAKMVRDFAAICAAPISAVPSLEEFIDGRNIPAQVAATSTASSQIAAKYMGQYPVLNATSYSGCAGHVGDMIELIGRIVEVKWGSTYHNKPYIFVNFGPWQGQAVKLSIWSEGIQIINDRPDTSWVGQWVSVVGLLEPPYHSRRYHYTHLSVSITLSNQIRKISETEARYRLGGIATKQSVQSQKPLGTRAKFPSAVPQAASRNADILLKMKQSAAATQSQQGKPKTASHANPAGDKPVAKGLLAKILSWLS